MNSYHHKTGLSKKLPLALGMCLSLLLFSACGLGAILDKQTEDTAQPPSSPQTAQEIPANTEAPTESTRAAVTPREWKSNWLHFGVDDQFSSYKPDETQIDKGNVADLQLVYGAGCDDGLFTVIGATPALYQGLMLVTYAGGNLEAGSPYTGLVDWDFGEQAYAWAPPPVVSTDGIVYYLYVTADSSSKLFALDSATGQKIWEGPTQFKTGFNYDAQVTVDEENGMLYVIEDQFSDGRLFGLDRATGEIKWFMGGVRDRTNPRFMGTFVPFKDNRLFVPAVIPEEVGDRTRMVSVDPSTQQIITKYDLPEELHVGWGAGWYGVCNNHLYETLEEGSREATVLVAHPLDQPDIAWQRDIPAQTARFACDPQEDTLFVPTTKSLLALNASTGDLLWEHNSLDQVFTPTIANGVVYYLSDTNMYALNQEDGSQLFRYPLGTNADPSTGVVVNDGLAIFSGSGGTCDFYVLGLQ